MSRLPEQARAVPAFDPFSWTWKRSPEFAAPFGHDFVTVTFGWAMSLFLNVHEAFVAVVPLATVAVAVLPEKAQFVPVPESNVYPGWARLLLSVIVCVPSLTFTNVTCPLASIGVHVPESSVKQYSPASAVTKLPVPRSTSLATVIFGSSMTWFAGTGTFCCPV